MWVYLQIVSLFTFQLQIILALTENKNIPWLTKSCFIEKDLLEYTYNHIETHLYYFACNTTWRRLKYNHEICCFHKICQSFNHYQTVTNYVHNIWNTPWNFFKTILNFHNLFNSYKQWVHYYGYFFKETKAQKGYRRVYTLRISFDSYQLLTSTHCTFFWRVFFHRCLFCKVCI